MKKLLIALLLLMLLPLAAPAEETVLLHTTAWLDDNTLTEFTQAYPHIRVEMVESVNSIQESVLSGAEIDVYQVEAAGAYEEILKKGYAAALENEALSAKAERLVPALKEIVFQDGKLLAFPAYLTLNTWTLDETAWLEAGFTLEEVPATLAQFLACFEKWQDDLAQDYADRYFFEGGSLAYLTRVLVRQYLAANESDTAAVSFDTPAFRETLAQLEQARPLFDRDAEQMQAIVNGEMEGGFPLIYNYGMSYGYTGLDSHIARPLAIPALQANAEPFTEGEASLYFVSARSAHPQEAALFINFLADKMNIETQYGLYSDCDQPVENPNFPALKERFTQELEEKRTQLQSCKPAEKQELEDRIAWLESWMTRQDEIRWVITQKDIDLHFSLTKNLRIPTDSLYLAQDSNCYSTLTGLISRFSAGEISADAFITEMDRTCSLAFLEQ